MGLFSGGNSSTSSTTNNYDQRVINETNNDGEFAGNEGELSYAFAETNIRTEIDGGAVKSAFDGIRDTSSEAFKFARESLATIEKSQTTEKDKLSETLAGLGELSSNIATQGTSDSIKTAVKYISIALAVVGSAIMLKG